MQACSGGKRSCVLCPTYKEAQEEHEEQRLHPVGTGTKLQRVQLFVTTTLDTPTRRLLGRAQLNDCKRNGR